MNERVVLAVVSSSVQPYLRAVHPRVSAPVFNNNNALIVLLPDGGDCTSCTRLVKWTPRVPASPALPALPHTQYTHTQSHTRRHGSRLGAGRRGWDAAEQRSRGRLAAVAGPVGRRQELCSQRVALFGGPRRCRRRVGRNTGGWQQQRRATSSSASRCRYEYGNDDGRLHQGKGSARASHPEAGPAHIRATSLPLFVPR